MNEKNACACAAGPKLIFTYSAALLLGLIPFMVACGRSSDAPESPGAESVPSAALAAPVIPADAAVLADRYPDLAGGALRLARLVTLPQGVLLQAEGLTLTEQDLEREIAQAPRDMRDQLRSNAFFVVEQRATGDLLRARARRSGGGSPDDERMVQDYLAQVVAGISVGDAEIEVFYRENREMMGGAPLERVASAIRQHLTQEKQQEAVEAHIRDLGRDLPMAVSAAWAADQAERARDNPVDRARASGIATFVSFGADSCMPCQMMKPFREAIAEKYGERLNVVYVHVNQDQILSSRYGVRGIPHIIFFDAAGREVHARTGFMPLEQIEEWIGRMGVEL